MNRRRRFSLSLFFSLSPEKSSCRCKERERGFFSFSAVLSFVRSVDGSLSSETRQKENSIGFYSSLWCLSYAFALLLTFRYVVERVSAGHTYTLSYSFVDSPFFYSFCRLSQHAHRDKWIRGLQITLALGLFRFLIFPFPSHHRQCRQAASN